MTARSLSIEQLVRLFGYAQLDRCNERGRHVTLDPRLKAVAPKPEDHPLLDVMLGTVEVVRRGPTEDLRQVVTLGPIDDRVCQNYLRLVAIEVRWPTGTVISPSFANSVGSGVHNATL